MENQDELTSTVSFEQALLLLLGATVGAVLALIFVPHWLPGLVSSLEGPRPKAYWYLARGSGVVAYLLVWASVVLGLLVSNKLSRLWPGGPAAVDLHQFTSLLGLSFALFHVLIFLGDRYINYTLPQLVIPFFSTGYRPFWVGLGQVGFYLAVPVAFSFYVRRQIGHRAWRLLHYSTFAVYLLVTFHGILAGTDTGKPVMVAVYSLTGIITFFLIMYRILIGNRQPRHRHKKRPAQT